MGITQKNILSQPQGIYLIESNLYLKVQKTGASFVFRYMKGGTRCDVGVGSARKVTISRAKEIAAKYRAEIAAGRDPKRDKTPIKEKVRTFQEVATEAVETTRKVRQWKREQQFKMWNALLRRYAYPVIGSKPIRDVTRQDIIDILSPLWQTMTPTAMILRAVLERVIECAQFSKEYVGENPARYRANLDIVLPSPAKVHRIEHRASLTFAETQQAIRQFLKEKTPTSLALAVIILTALRRNEVALAEWTEINLEAGIFTVPAVRRKVARDYPHRVPISAHVAAILRHLKELGGDGYVFKSPLRKGKPIVGSGIINLVKRKFPNATTHGFRSTFRVWVEETDQNAAAAEYQMMHENPSAVVRAYQRSDLLDKRRVLMQRWADALIPLDELDKILVEN